MRTILIQLLLLITITTNAGAHGNDVLAENLKGKVQSVILKGYTAKMERGEPKKSQLITTSIKRFNPLGSYTEITTSVGRDVMSGSTRPSGRMFYKYDNLNNLIASTSYNSDGSLKDSSIHEVDQMGNRTDWRIYRSDGSIEWEYVKEYDNAGNLLETNDFHNGRLESRHTYRYNDNSKCTMETVHDPSGRLKSRTVFKYDARGNKTEAMNFKSDGSFDTRITYAYNEMGKVIEEREYATDLVDKYTRILRDYDEQGNIIGTKQYDEHGTMLYEGRQDRYGNHLADIAYNTDGTLHDKLTSEYQYDSNGNELVEVAHFNDGSTVTSTCRYIYDKTGNWTTKIVMEDKQAVRIIEREIAYY